MKMTLSVPLLNQCYARHPECFPPGIDKSVVMITCFLHLFIAIRDGCKRKYREQFELIGNEFWYCYEAGTKRSFAQRWSAFMRTCRAHGDWLPKRMMGKLSRANESKLARLQSVV